MDIISTINGNPRKGLSASQLVYRSVLKRDCVWLKLAFDMRLHVQSASKHADIMPSMRWLKPIVVVLLWVYVGIFSIFCSIDGRAKLPIVKFWWSIAFPGYVYVCETFLFNDSKLFIPSGFHLMLKEFMIDWVTWSIVTMLYKCFMVTLLWFLLIFLWFEYKKFLCLIFSSLGCWKLDAHNIPFPFLTEVFLLLTLITTYCLKLN